MDATAVKQEAQCPGCAARDRRIARLEAQVAQLSRQVEALSHSTKRQAAPFSKGDPEPNPKRPGRKAGLAYGPKAHRPIPPGVPDQVLEAPLPPACPGCGGKLIQEGVVHQHQLEIPRKPLHRRFDIHVGRCARCGRRVRGRHELQTSDALGCAASQIGPEAQAAVVMLNKDLGLAHGKISRFFQDFFGIPLSRGGGCQIMLRAAARLEENYQTIVQRVRASPRIVRPAGGSAGCRLGCTWRSGRTRWPAWCTRGAASRPRRC
jgi:transposase